MYVLLGDPEPLHSSSTEISAPRLAAPLSPVKASNVTRDKNKRPEPDAILECGTRRRVAGTQDHGNFREPAADIHRPPREERHMTASQVAACRSRETACAERTR